jgi:hypothetical protein
MVKMNKETEYEKDLNEMKEQIIKEGNTLLTKKDLLERFCKIDKEYKGRPWNLLQILANINILIGEEPCEDCISRQAVLAIAGDSCLDLDSYDDAREFCDEIKELPPVQSKPKVGHWIEIAQYSDGKHKIECSECKGLIFSRGHANSFVVKNEYKFCPHCGVRMVEPHEREG